LYNDCFTCYFIIKIFAYMSVVDLVMPKMGESIMEATILKWHKNVGDTINMDETLLEIATDKVDSEVPSTSAGVITEILFKVNDVVPVGTIIARISSEATQNIATTPAAPLAPVEETVDIPQQASITTNQPSIANTGSNKFYSPLVLNIAASEGVSFAELEKINGTGNEGRVTKKDIIEYVTNRNAGVITTSPIQKTEVTTQAVVVSESKNTELAKTNHTPTNYQGNVEIIAMDRMRKLIAKHMVDSKHTSPHVTSFTEADVTNLVMWRDKTKKDFEKREGEKITFTPLFIEAIIKCIKKYPLINCSLDGDNIIIKKDINIGMATALPSGNLIVPVIKHADQLNLVGLTKQVNGLANAARTNKLKPDDTQGGTFTLTNVGTFGSLMGTPIINQPQVAILAVGAIKKRPVVIETPQGDSIAIRHMMYLSMSYDHRIVDGALGATFLTAVANELQNFDGERAI
jgi:2-oxoglutarate dehydrogenase E2 component (dihydrolipoamide succinyltransferase)